jgi:predicted nucleic acid-binding protein
VPAFIDTNIVVYADDAAYPKKQKISAKLIADLYKKGDAVISAQVMQEYYNAAVNILRLPSSDCASCRSSRSSPQRRKS